jgi:hypothetical protein
MIEDCSPYYVRFSDPAIEKIFNICDRELNGVIFTKDFTHYKFSEKHALEIKDVCPLFGLFDLNLQRVSVFVSGPGMYYLAHKDGFNHHWSLNYTYKILDEECKTNWYSDEELKRYPIGNLHRLSRECLGFRPERHKPLKTMTATPNELILFNTEIFHDWDNRSSQNSRMILTLRLKNYEKGPAMFEDAKKILLSAVSQTKSLTEPN